MKVQVKLAYRHANYPSNTALDPEKVYELDESKMHFDTGEWDDGWEVCPATNQPDYEEKGKIFVECPNGAPALMLEREDYILIEA